MPSKEKEFLLEVGAEEIPAWMMEPALADLKRLLEEGLRKFHVLERSVSFEMFGTPRRLIAYCPRLRPMQPTATELTPGPPKKVAFDSEGKPTAALMGFLRKMGGTLDNISVGSTPKGEYTLIKKVHPGRPTADILAEVIPPAVLAIPFPRTMYWEGKAGPHFIRPIRSLLALYGGRVISCAVGSVRAGNWTFGHRRLGKPRLPVRDFAGYRETLRNNFVLLDPQERRARIVEQIQSLLASEPGFRWKQNEELLDTLVYLTEYPTPLLGAFDPAFLALPEEVLITVMRGHQKYFAVEQANGTIAPRFVAVMNLDQDRTGAIRHGHERVLRARFNDARFFWETDAKTYLASRVEMLKGITFQSELGTYYDKAQRMSELAISLARAYFTAVEPQPDMVRMLAVTEQAARLSKCDLTTELVKEFTELQGVIGGLSARRDGLPHGVADAIYDHYKPESMEDSSPRTPIGALVSLADRMDTLVGYFGVGLAPSGSKDPFGLRRAGNGVVRILLDYEIEISFTQLVEWAEDLYDQAKARGNLPEWHRRLVADKSKGVATFLVERLRYYLREIRGFAYDEVNAVIQGEWFNPTDVLRRCEAVARIRPTENFEPLAVAFKRIKNILRQAEEKGLFSRRKLEERLLEPGPEKELYDIHRDIFQQAAREKSAGNYFAALEAIASLRPAVDRFFDKGGVMVMAPEADLRENRLTLLATLLSEFSTIADFSEIVPKE